MGMFLIILFIVYLQMRGSGFQDNKIAEKNIEEDGKVSEKRIEERLRDGRL